LILEELEERFVPSAYYVSPSGDDTLDGHTPATAWRTIARVNAHTYAPGDNINFQGGATFGGSLRFYPPGSGTANNPIIVTSYGGGRATISSDDQEAVLFYGGSGYEISQLNLVGSGVGNNSADGLAIVNDRGTVIQHFVVDQVDISGYGSNGLTISAVGNNTQIQNIRVTHVTLHDNYEGFHSGSEIPSAQRIVGLYIGDSEAYQNVQAGITLFNVNSGVVERSLIHNNGFSGGDTYSLSAWNSSQITFQYNESWNTIDPNGEDGEGFLLGGGVTDSVMQYNYSHDNAGYGFLLWSKSPYGPNVGNSVRYNVSENDTRLIPWASSVAVAGSVSNAEIYNNTFYIGPTADDLPRAGMTTNDWVGSAVHFRNNIFQVAPGDWAVIADASVDSGLSFQGNAYYTGLPNAQFFYNAQPFYSLSDWQAATGQETLFGLPVGYEGDPMLTAPGQGGTIGNPDLLSTLTAYQLQSGSPVRTAGLDLLTLFGIDIGLTDFYGNALAGGAGFSIGAHQPPLGDSGQLGSFGFRSPVPDDYEAYSLELGLPEASQQPKTDRLARTSHRAGSDR
jgi:hypothetical protein